MSRKDKNSPTPDLFDFMAEEDNDRQAQRSEEPAAGGKSSETARLSDLAGHEDFSVGFPETLKTSEENQATAQIMNVTKRVPAAS